MFSTGLAINKNPPGIARHNEEKRNENTNKAKPANKSHRLHIS